MMAAGTVTHSWVRIEVRKLSPRLRDDLLERCELRLSYDIVRFNNHLKVHPNPIPSCPLCRGVHDNKVRLYWVYDGILRFPTGLYPLMHDVLNQVQLRDMRRWDKVLGEVEKLPCGIELRPYQKEAVKVLLENRRGMLAAPTGSGKTAVIGASLIYACPKPVLWICHTIALADQTRQVLSQNLNTPVGLIGAGKEQIEPVTVALIQTLWSRRMQLRNYFGSVKTLIVDECHHSAARTYFKVIQSCFNAGYRFGLSATPYRNEEGENLWLMGAIGKLLMAIPPETLISEGFIAEPTVVFLHLKPITLTPADLNDWSLIYKKGVVENPVRNSLILSAASLFKPSLILVWSIEHGEILLKLAKGRGLKALFVHGETPATLRMQAIKDLNEGNLDTLIASDIFKEGVDIPSVPTLINAAGQKSKVATIQRIGRALRPKPPHNKALIVDFFDSVEPLRTHSHHRYRALSALFYTIITNSLSNLNLLEQRCKV